MTASLRAAVDAVLTGKHHTIAQPHLPTEDEWAKQVATLCNWL